MSVSTTKQSIKMGLVNSIPLCSRNKEGGDDGAGGADANNNQPMPSLQHHPGMVVSVQPVSMANPNVRLDDLAGGGERREERSYSSSLESSEGGAKEEEEEEREMTTTSDSGLEQSSSDELELGAAALGERPRSSTNPAIRKLEEQEQQQERPFSAADNREDDGMVQIPLENHDTCCEDDDDEDEDEPDPVERPPEPTVPDERVDTSSSSNEGSPRYVCI